MIRLYFFLNYTTDMINKGYDTACCWCKLFVNSESVGESQVQHNPWTQQKQSVWWKYL